MKSRSEIWYALLTDVSNACSVSTIRDRNTVANRLTAEGESFFTISLPAYEKDFLRSLELGWIPADAFVGFKRRKVRGAPKGVRGVPELFGELMELLFTSECGRFVDGRIVKTFTVNPVLREFDKTDSDVLNRTRIACRSIRQLCLLFSKEKSVADRLRVDKAIQEYLQTDAEVTLPLPIGEPTYFSKVVFSQSQRESFMSFLDRHFPL